MNINKVFSFHAFSLLTFNLSANPTTQVIDLKTNYLKSLIGIDNPNLRLSWVIEDERVGMTQSSYKIMDQQRLHEPNQQQRKGMGQ